ncbi:hypothetical protein, partial [Rhizobium brockwellii]|uniref:hypothetical protein n=1 Tax=Rhizobium brockwellii TaxID=3019932 RepID=UPI003F9D7386
RCKDSRQTQTHTPHNHQHKRKIKIPLPIHISAQKQNPSKLTHQPLANIRRNTFRQKHRSQ